MSDTIQLITSVGALLLGAAYVIGGLIVNLHLSRYGVTEYQVLRVKYLVVGLIYMASFIVTFILSAVLLFLMVATIPTFTLSDSLLAVSLLAAAALMVLWGYGQRVSVIERNQLISWTVFAVLTAISLMYPLKTALYQTITQSNAVEDKIRLFGVALIGILSLMGQLYFYSRYLYGNINSLDAIGMGIPVKVKLAGTEENITLLAHLGLPTQPPDMTAEVLLIDETDSHYILGNGAGAAMKVFKIDKALIKGIVYV